MNLSIVIIGDEILLGRVTDTNSGCIARTFDADGWTVKKIFTVSDKAEDIRNAIEAALECSNLVITTGGLGPTKDDITKGVLTEFFGGELYFNEEVERNVLEIFKNRNLKINELTRNQALVPSSCTVVQNTLGTAPIMCFDKSGKMLIAMPGVPYETRGMLPVVAEHVKERFGMGGNVLHAEYTLAGMSESALAERLDGFEKSLPVNYKLAYLPSPGEILLRLDADYSTGGDSAEFANFCKSLEEYINPYLIGKGKASPAEIVIAKMRQSGMSIATAESCTGGNIAHLITSVPGSSDVMKGGVVSYANQVKINVLGVSADDIEKYGAVSENVVRQMAAGVQKVCGAQCAVATSGIAGPGGGTPDKPVGTVWIAAATPTRCVAELCHFRGDRQAVIDRASAHALMLLANIAEGEIS